MADVNKDELSRLAYTLCLEIENLPASEQQTRCSVLANQLLTALGVRRGVRSRAATGERERVIDTIQESSRYAVPKGLAERIADAVLATLGRGSQGERE